jgi:hypothetical protein
MKPKTIFTIISLLIILIAIPVTIFLVGQQQELRQRAAANTTLSLKTATTEPTVGDTITVDIDIDTGVTEGNPNSGNRVGAAQIYLLFDPTILELTNLSPSTFFPSPGGVGISKDNVNGKGTITVFSGETPAVGSSGKGTVATATFQAKGPGSVEIKFGPQTAVPGVNDTPPNVLNQSLPVSLTVTSDGGDTGDDEQVEATVTPTQTIVPTSTGGFGGGSDGTNTPTVTVAPTQAPSNGTLAITSPSNGAVVTQSTPTISGTGKAGSTITLTLTGTETVTGVATTNSSGNWSIVPSSPLSDGAITVTVTQQATDGSTTTATSAFTVQTQDVPVSGAVENTLILAAIGILLLFVGVGLPLLR